MPRARDAALLAPLVLLAIVVGCGGGSESEAKSAKPAATASAAASGKHTGVAQSFVSAPSLHPAAVKITRHAKGTAAGDVFVAPRPDRNAAGGPMIFDSSGHLVWFREAAKGQQAIAFTMQRYKGKPVLIWGNRPNDSYEHAYLTVLDSSYHQIAKLKAGRGDGTDLHDFELTPRNTALLIGFHPVRRNLAKYGGSARGQVLDGTVQEVSIPGGKVLWRWSALAHIPLSESVANVPKGEPWDAYHVNSVSEAKDGNLLVSVRHTSTLYKVNRKTGKIMWRLGGKHSNFKVSRKAIFAFQHDARWGPSSTITLFDNGSTSNSLVEKQSSGLRIKLHGTSVSLVRRFRHKPPLKSESQGSLQALSNGDSFIGWGNKAFASEYDSHGRLVWEAKFPSNEQQSYSARRYAWTGTPTTKPALAASRAGGTVTLHASWNGATEVERWQALAGASPTSLQPTGAAASKGFETALKVKTPAALVAVQALDAGGHVLGTSKAISPR